MKIEKIFQDKDGNVVVLQKPNLPLWIWLAASIGERILVETSYQRPLEFIAFGAIFSWGYLEISDGANSFRRFLGVAVVLLIIVNKF